MPVDARAARMPVHGGAALAHASTPAPAAVELPKVPAPDTGAADEKTKFKGGEADRLSANLEQAQPAVNEASEFGMIGLLPSAGERPDDTTTPRGDMWGGNIADVNGKIAGVGEGGGGDGIGLGSIGTIGHGAGPTGGGWGGRGRVLGGNHRADNQNAGSKNAPSKSVETFQAIDNKEGERPRSRRLIDGKPIRSTVVPRTEVEVRVSDVPHAAIRCGGAAFLAFDERVQLWRERLARVAGNADGVAAVYRRALALCEAPTWRERSKLYALDARRDAERARQGPALAGDVQRPRRRRRAIPRHPRARPHAERHAPAPRRARAPIDRSGALEEDPRAGEDARSSG